MKGAATSSSTSNELHYYTFWDMDDTLLTMQKFTFKNPHLLLPILLYQTHSPNQELGVMTLRPPQDDTVEYSVKDFVTDVAHFGIEFPQNHIVFCGGGELDVRDQRSRLDSDAAFAYLISKFRELSLTKGEQAQVRIAQLEAMKKELHEAKHLGKNNFICFFLESKLNKETQIYQFSKSQCHASLQRFVLVDDADRNASAISALGENFRGILASKPGKILAGDDESLWYSINYLTILAEHIGFAHYALDVLQNPKGHRDDNTMQQFAALLYCWQAFPDKCLVENFYDIEKRLNSKEYIQVFSMLDYIKENTSAHPLTQFRAVDGLLEFFKVKANYVLKERLSILEQEINELFSPSPSSEKEGSMKKIPSFPSFFKKQAEQSKSAPATTRASVDENKLRELQVAKQKVVRLLGLMQDARSVSDKLPALSAKSSASSSSSSGVLLLSSSAKSVSARASTNTKTESEQRRASANDGLEGGRDKEADAKKKKSSSHIK